MFRLVSVNGVIGYAQFRNAVNYSSLTEGVSDRRREDEGINDTNTYFEVVVCKVV